MAFYGDCIACRFGRHDGHVEVVRSVPRGMMGGHICLCKGDCAERRKVSHIEKQVAELVRLADSTEGDG